MGNWCQKNKYLGLGQTGCGHTEGLRNLVASSCSCILMICCALKESHHERSSHAFMAKYHIVLQCIIYLNKQTISALLWCKHSSGRPMLHVETQTPVHCQWDVRRCPFLFLRLMIILVAVCSSMATMFFITFIISLQIAARVILVSMLDTLQQHQAIPGQL